MESNNKPRPRRVPGGAEALTPFIVMALIGIFVVTGWLQQRSLSESNTSASGNGLTMFSIWTGAGASIITFFAIIAPLVLLGIFATSKIFNFRFLSGLYMRSAAIAAVPVIAISAAELLSDRGLTVGTLLIGSIPLAVLLAMNLFQLSFIETGAAAAICAVMFLIGWVTSRQLADLALSSLKSNPLIVRVTSPATAPVTNKVSVWPSAPVPGNTAPVDPQQRRLDDLSDRLAVLAADDNLTRVSRQQYLARLEPLESEAEALRASEGSAAQWQRVVDRLRELSAQAASLPSETPDEAIYQPLAADQNWSSSSATGDEISFDAFNLRLPSDARLDLHASEPGPLGMAWNWRNSGATLSLRMAAFDARQRRPWVVPHRVIQNSAAAHGLFVIEADQAKVSTGTLAGQTFVRVETSDSSHPQVIYTGQINGQWIIATITSASNSQIEPEIETAVKSLRKRAADQPKSDPFAPIRLVQRLADDPERAASLLKAEGSASEDALLVAVNGNETLLLKAQGSPAQGVIPMADSASTSAVRTRALVLLADLATEKSLPTMRWLAQGSDRDMAAAARAVLRRIAPQEFDEAAVAVDLLKTGTTLQQCNALRTLASLPRDVKRPQITRAIEPFVLEEDPRTHSDAVKALAVWANEGTVPKLLPWLSHDSTPERRTAAFTILAAVKDRRAVVPIINWLIEAPEETIRTLIAMGPVVEDEVIRVLLENREAAARKNAARILQEIGGAKSVPALQRESTDPRDASAARIAGNALQVVRKRTQSTTPATLPLR